MRELGSQDAALLSVMIGAWRLSKRDKDAWLSSWQLQGDGLSMVAFAESMGLLRPRSTATLDLVGKGVLRGESAGHLLERDGLKKLRGLLSAKGAGRRVGKSLRVTGSTAEPDGNTIRIRLDGPNGKNRGTLSPGSKLGRCTIVTYPGSKSSSIHFCRLRTV